jgi:hypothetical protein
MKMACSPTLTLLVLETVGPFILDGFRRVLIYISVAGRTLLHTILTSLERISFNGDPLQFMLVETTYQPFISFFHQTGITVEHPELAGIRMYPVIVLEQR